MSPKRPKNFYGMSNESYIYIFAEIGINHNGSLDTAKELIDISVEIGCDAVKFQKRTIDIVYSEDTLNQPRESPWGSTQRAQKRDLNCLLMIMMSRFVLQRENIDWFASSWDHESQILMRKYDFPFNKIASAMAVNSSFVELVASEGKPTFASTGMTTLKDIDRLISYLIKKIVP